MRGEASTVTDRTSPAAGIAFVATGVFCLTVNDALVKWIGEIYPVVQIVFFRMLFALPIIMGMAFVLSGRGALATRRPGFHLIRGVMMAAAAFSFYWGLTMLPLAEVTAIAFSAPLFVTVFAILLLKERPDASQWLVTLIGFIGILMIVRPGSDAFTIAVIAPIITAIAYALFMLTARMLHDDERLWATMAWATLVPLIISAACLPWIWQTPALVHLPFFIGSGIFGGLGLALISQGFRLANATVVAPFDYTGMVWAVIFGWWIWGETPAPLAIAGGLIIAGCGIHLAWKHGRASRRRSFAATLPPP